VKYACIARHQGEFFVRLMCRVLAVSRSGFYAWQRRPPSARGRQDQGLLVAVRAAYRKSRRTYGAPRVHRELRAAGTRVSRKRIARLMRADGLVARPRRRYVHTTDSGHGDPIAPNRVDRQFAVQAVGALRTIRRDGRKGNFRERTLSGIRLCSATSEIKKEARPTARRMSSAFIAANSLRFSVRTCAARIRQLLQYCADLCTSLYNGVEDSARVRSSSYCRYPAPPRPPAGL